MSYTKVGECPHCGAPIYVPTVWWAILPPPPTYSCSCRFAHGALREEYVTTTTTTCQPGGALIETSR